MKKNHHFIKDLSFIFALIIIIYCFYSCFIYARLYFSIKGCPSDLGQELLRIKIYGSSSGPDGNTVSATFSIIDTNGNEIAVIERSWSGAYLAVEFSKLSLFNENYIFPSKIYGKDRIIDEYSLAMGTTLIDNRFAKGTAFLDKLKFTSSGTDLVKYYNENNQCMLLGYESTYKKRNRMYCISSFATGKIPVLNFGFSEKLIIDLSNCSSDRYYSIKSSYNGDLIIQEL